MGEDMVKAGMILDHERHVYHSLKEGGQAIINTRWACMLVYFLRQEGYVTGVIRLSVKKKNLENLRMDFNEMIDR